MIRAASASESAETLFMERLSERWALIFDHSSDAFELRQHLHGNCTPRRHVQVARVHCRRAHGPKGHGDIPVHIYEPLSTHTTPGANSRPALIVYFHGGGFVLRDSVSRDADCRRLANGVGAVVVAVDYRLAPQNPFPAAPEDAWVATRWAADIAEQIGCDPHRVAVAGEGAGANLAIGVCLLARDRSGPPIAFQLLICPVVDQRRQPAPTPTAPRAAVVTAEHLHWFSDQYLASDRDRLNPLASPLFAELSTLPPAHLVLAHADPQRAAGEQFARQLRAAGVPTTARCYPGMLHGFYNLADQLDTAARANTDVHTILRDALNNPNPLNCTALR